MKHNIIKTLLVTSMVTTSLINLATAVYAAWIVPNTPSNNLLVNPWFRDSTGPSLNGWVDATPDGFWNASNKDGNPTPFTDIEGTSARLSVGEDGLAKTIDPGKDAYLYQVVKADPTQKTLSFDLYWVAHTVDTQVTVSGSNSQNGPWTKVWTPFDKTITTVYKPPMGSGSANQYLWQYYSNSTNVVSTTLTQGYEYYKVEVHAVLPDMQGGFKITGMYFAAGNSQPSDPGEPTPDPVDPTDPRPDPVDPGEPKPDPVDPRPVQDNNPRHDQKNTRRNTEHYRKTTNNTRTTITR